MTSLIYCFFWRETALDTDSIFACRLHLFDSHAGTAELVLYIHLDSCHHPRFPSSKSNRLAQSAGRQRLHARFYQFHRLDWQRNENICLHSFWRPRCNFESCVQRLVGAIGRRVGNGALYAATGKQSDSPTPFKREDRPKFWNNCIYHGKLCHFSSCIRLDQCTAR